METDVPKFVPRRGTADVIGEEHRDVLREVGMLDQRSGKQQRTRRAQDEKVVPEHPRNSPQGWLHPLGAVMSPHAVLDHLAQEWMAGSRAESVIPYRPIHLVPPSKQAIDVQVFEWKDAGMGGEARQPGREEH